MSRKGMIPAAILTLVGLVLAAQGQSQPTSAPAKDYEIKFDRPVKVGQKFQSSATGSFMQSVTVKADSKAQPGNIQKMVYELSGVREVLEVNKLGFPTKLAFTVDKCVEIEGNKRTEAAPKGTVVVVSAKDDRVSIEAKDANTKLSGDALRVLSGLKVTPFESSDDLAYGTKDRKKVGDTWPINAEYIAKTRGKSMGGAPLKAENISGQVKLLGVSKVEGIDCLDISIDMVLKDAYLLPAEATADRNEMKMTFSLHLPLDESIYCIGGKQSESLSVSMKMEMAKGIEITIDIQKQTDSSGTDIPIKK